MTDNVFADRRRGGGARGRLAARRERGGGQRADRQAGGAAPRTEGGVESGRASRALRASRARRER